MCINKLINRCRDKYEALARCSTAAILVIFTLRTDRRTDRQADRRAIKATPRPLGPQIEIILSFQYFHSHYAGVIQYGVHAVDDILLLFSALFYVICHNAVRNTMVRRIIDLINIIAVTQQGGNTERGGGGYISEFSLSTKFVFSLFLGQKLLNMTSH